MVANSRFLEYQYKTQKNSNDLLMPEDLICLEASRNMFSYLIDFLSTCCQNIEIFLPNFYHNNYSQEVPRLKFFQLLLRCSAIIPVVTSSIDAADI